MDKKQDADARVRRAAERLLVLLGQLLEELTPEQLDLKSVRSISSTLKDIRDLQTGEDEDGQKLTVVLEGGLEDFAK